MSPKKRPDPVSDKREETRTGDRQERFERDALVHLNAIYASALRMIGKDKDAEDLTQEVFLKAFNKFDTFQDGTNCKAWLYKILLNTVINEFRRRKSAPAKVDFKDVEAFVPSEGTLSAPPSSSRYPALSWMFLSN